MPTTISAMRVEFLPEDKKPSACISCGKCKKICPQNIDIPQAMQDLTKALEKIPSWTEVCRQREAAQKKLEKLEPKEKKAPAKKACAKKTKKAE